MTYVISPTKAKRVAEKEDVSAYPATSLVLATLVGILLMALILVLTFNMKKIGLEESLNELVESYLLITAVSVIPALIFQVLKENLQAFEKTLFANGLILFFNVVNILANVILMFYFDLGICGAAVATIFSRFAMALILLLYTSKVLTVKWAFSATLLSELFRKGIPVGFAGLVTAFVFSLVTLLVGKMSLAASAANNIIITISSVTYMVPYALASASSVKIGKRYGEKKIDEIGPYGLAAVTLGLISATVMALVFYLIPEKILRIATDDMEVIRYGVLLLFSVAIYQIPDTIQCITMGSLRGMGVTLKPMIFSIIGIWLIGFPLGCYLAYERGMEAVGLWYGLAAGLTVMALLFSILFIRTVTDKRSFEYGEIIVTDKK